jgi:hypothetical protein
MDQERTPVDSTDTDEQVRLSPTTVRTSGEELFVQEDWRGQVQPARYLRQDEAYEVCKESAQQLLEDLVMLGGHEGPGIEIAVHRRLSLTPL